MRITIAPEQRHDPAFGSLQIAKIVILGGPNFVGLTVVEDA
jgi:hypothetical protein